MKIITTIQPLLQDKLEFNPSETMKWLTYNQPIFWSFGVSKTINVNNKGLLIRVSARRHTGWILITLNGSDLYDVHLLNTLGKVKKVIEDVYCDTLLDVIDDSIERIPEYTIWLQNPHSLISLGVFSLLYLLFFLFFS